MVFANALVALAISLFQVVALIGASVLRGASFNTDVMLHARLLWRTELRYLKANNALFPDRSAAGRVNDDAVFVTSLSLTL